MIGYTYGMINIVYIENKWTYYTFCTAMIIKWMIKLSMTHQVIERTICRPLIFGWKYILMEGGNRYLIDSGFSNSSNKWRSSTGISGGDRRLSDLFTVFFASDNNGLTVNVLSEMHDSIVCPNVFPTKYFSFVISKVN